MHTAHALTPHADAVPTHEPAICTTGVCVDIDSQRILDEVDFVAQPGEVHALIGPNGAGKSTLLAVIAGDQATTAGAVRIAGRPLAEWQLRALARERAVLLQDHSVFFPFTVRQVVEMGRAPWARTAQEDEDDAAVAAALTATDIEHLAERRLPTLSGGERARAAFARVLAQRTGILLLDEPTAALDLGHQEAVLQLARERARAGDAVVVVLHDLSLAAAWSDRITLLERGRVVASGTPGDVLTAERVSAVYRHPVEVIRHPLTDVPIILPVRQLG
ncbi:heme ABC transporter ATP-binding protein [Glaciibacter psychrotolerans]|uniref:Iron complex transport system ATP-binding protein n=1 Tax=Glaciibacter psychrotolerans TaxID=670054 RepID=A0A7Z0EGV4_9MICO|nr:heme ABC transporter ATP-binding protein [Leifsonia psychrotolerans]NYJ21315.1 iron complex transport system ATP-binding protein [Leifsonia psychrotolerans]